MFAEEKGSIMMIILLILVMMGVFATAVLPLTNNEFTVAMRNSNGAQAEYIAQAAIKIGVKIVKKYLKDTNNPGSCSNTLANQVFTTGYGTYDLVYAPNNSTNPTQIEITATGHYTINGKTLDRITRAAVILKITDVTQPGPGVLDLITPDASFSHNKPWKVVGNPPVGNPPDSGSNQVLFNDQLASSFKIDYYATLQKTFAANATGYGIYYGATGNANNMTSYVFQYDPGAWNNADPNNPLWKNGSFFVKKVVSAINPSTQNPWQNETRIFYRAFEDNSASNGTVQVSIAALTTIMNNYYKNELPAQGKTPPYSNFSCLGQKHNITIEVKKVSGKDRHFVCCDGKEILNFVDNDPNYQAIPFEGKRTGLRVWNATTDFYNSPSTSYGQFSSQKIKWLPK